MNVVLLSNAVCASWATRLVQSTLMDPTQLPLVVSHMREQ